MPRVLGGSQGGGRLLVSEVPLYFRGKAMFIKLTDTKCGEADETGGL